MYYKFTLKTLSLFSIVALLVIVSCTEQLQSDDASAVRPEQLSTAQAQTPAQRIFTKSVGAPIAGEIGRRWISNYARANGSALVAYTINKVRIDAILGAAGCVGVSFFYATDDNGALHILPIGTDSNGRRIQASFVCTQNGDIDWPTACQWISNYSGVAKAHFMGSTILSRISCGQIRTTRALDDSGAEQLLLSDASKTQPSTYYDRSVTCPPFCESI